MKLLLITLSFLGLFSSLGWCQGNLLNPSTVTVGQASHESSGSAKAEEVSVNQSTGVPQISVPLAIISSKSIEMPFSLRYNASGRRLDETASSVGWGWSLNGGGTIRRIIKGLPDERYRCMLTSFLPNSGSQDPITFDGVQVLDSWEWLEDPLHEWQENMSLFVHSFDTVLSDSYTTFYVTNNIYPTFQQDEFYFDFNGVSGMFVLDSFGVATCIPYSNLKITYSECFQEFQIEDSEGNTFIFDVPTITESSLEPWGASQKGASTWYLTQVKDNNGLVELDLSYSDEMVLQTKNIANTINFYQVEESKASTDVFVDVTQYRHLLEVTSNTGEKIEFRYVTDRFDLPADKELNEVVFLRNNIEQSKIKLEYGYFLDQTGQKKRLKLTALRAVNAANEELLLQSFTYNENIVIPSDLLFSGRDHWGYYNGLNDLSRVTSLIHGEHRIVDPSTNQIGMLSSMQSGTGSKVSFLFETNTYSESPNAWVAQPSGALVSYIDESIVIPTTDQISELYPNEEPWHFVDPNNAPYYIPDNNFGVAYTFRSSAITFPSVPENGSDGQFLLNDLNDVDNPANPLNTDILNEEHVYVPSLRSRSKSRTFALDLPQSITISGIIGKSIVPGHPFELKLIKLGTTEEVIHEWQGSNTEITTLTNVESGVLGIGAYKFELKVYFPFFNEVMEGEEPINFEVIDALIEIQTSYVPREEPRPSVYAKYGGGLRIKSIVYDDGDQDVSNNLTQNFTYQFLDNPTLSSGYLFSDPSYSFYIPDYLERRRKTGLGCGGASTQCYLDDLTSHVSSGVNPLITINGSYLVYRNVSVRSCIGESCNNGETVYIFSSEPTQNVGPIIRDRAPIKHWKYGLPIEVRTYNAEGALVSTKHTSYGNVINNPKTVQGLLHGRVQERFFSRNNSECKNQENRCGGDVRCNFLVYDYVQELYMPLSETVRLYDQVNTNNYLETRMEYEYSRDLAGAILTATSFFPHSGKFQRTLYRYVGDYLNPVAGDDMSTALNYMNETRKINAYLPIEVLSLEGTNDEDVHVVGGSLSTYRLFENNIIADATYQIELERPVPLSGITHFPSQSFNGVFTFSSKYRKIREFSVYDTEGRLLEWRRPNDMYESNLIDPISGLPYLSARNARLEEIKYIGFEEYEHHEWLLGDNTIVQEDQLHLGLTIPAAISGSRHLRFSGSLGISTALASGVYKLTFWSKGNGAPTVSNTGSASILQETFGAEEGNPDWRYNQYLLNVTGNATIEISGVPGSDIDEIRIHPNWAEVSTMAYNQRYQVVSSCDASNRFEYYLYDGWDRVQWVLDDSQDIISYSEYYEKEVANLEDRSSLKTKTPLEEGLTKAEIVTSSPFDLSIRTVVEYFDGFGRSVQSSAVRQSPGERDIIGFQVYNALGQEPTKYLSFTKAGNNGDFISDVITEQAYFYQHTPRVAPTLLPYQQTRFEAAPTARTLRLGGIGAGYELDEGRNISVNYSLNEMDEVLLWDPIFGPSGKLIGVKAQKNVSLLVPLPNYYASSSLVKKIVTDVDGRNTIEFTNALGQVVCKRVIAQMFSEAGDLFSEYRGSGRFTDSQLVLPGPINGPSALSSLQEVALDTYYVYDEFGRLIVELPPAIVQRMGTNYQLNFEGSQTSELYDGFATVHWYGERGRLQSIKKPGEEKSHFLYNSIDQLVASRSPELPQGQWKFIKYDALGRTVQTGLWMNDLLYLESMQEERDQQQVNLWEERLFDQPNNYSNVSFPQLSSSDIILTELYFDRYNFPTQSLTFDPPQNTTTRLMGNELGSKIRVLDDPSNRYMMSIEYFDVKGQLIKKEVENHLGGRDKLTYAYDYSGQVTGSERLHYFDSQTYDPLRIEDVYEYDHAGRLKEHKMRIESEEWITVSRLRYDELGRMHQKQLHIPNGANRGMQIIDYRYDVQGRLVKINNADLVDDGDNLQHWDVFGQELFYDDVTNYYSTTMEAIPQWNGSISAIKWKTKSSDMQEQNGATMPGHGYVYRYDDLGRMTGAYYAASSATEVDNYSENENAYDERLRYDAMGNILSIRRHRSPSGFNSGGVLPIAIDRLQFFYNNSNKVIRVNDLGLSQQAGSTTATTLIDFTHFTSETSVYAYDAEGRLINDSGKDFSYAYNHMDLTKQVSKGSETVEFIWDALGNKLEKRVNGTVASYYLAGVEYKNMQLDHIAMPEGCIRLREDVTTEPLGRRYVFDYCLNDHLGNVCAIVTDENAPITREKVTMELERRIAEDESFENVSLTAKDRPFLYPYDPTDPNNHKVAELNAQTGTVMGPAKVLPTRAGRKFEISTKYWFADVNQVDPLTSTTELLAGILLNLATAGGGIVPMSAGEGLALLNNVNGPQFAAVESFVNNTFSNNHSSGAPDAYLVYMLFDEDMQLIPAKSGALKVQQANVLGTLEQTEIISEGDGYLYVYLTNRSGIRTNFDNLEIRYVDGQIRGTWDYYPYGLPWNNHSTTDIVRDDLYQSKEFQQREFSNATGLDLYDFHARMYDPVTCRWQVPDPAAQFANPYLAMGNDPVLGVDPDGRWVHIVAGALIGGIVNMALMSHNCTTPQDWLTAFAIGAVAGGAGAATFGAATVASGAATYTATGLAFTGSGGLVATGMAGAVSAGAQTLIQGYGNYHAFNESLPSAGDMALSMGLGFGFGAVPGYFAARHHGLPVVMNGKGAMRGSGTGSGKQTFIEVGSANYGGQVGEKLMYKQVFAGRAAYNPQVGAAKGGSSWVYGAFKTEAKWAGQLSKRGWTAEQITEAVTRGKSFDAVNMVNKANSATRYVHPTTGQSVVIDDVTKELLHVGGPGFKY
jgi:RHS repeat-associated protein